jgi:hypothetical protein
MLIYAYAKRPPRSGYVQVAFEEVTRIKISISKNAVSGQLTHRISGKSCRFWGYLSQVDIPFFSDLSNIIVDNHIWPAVGLCQTYCVDPISTVPFYGIKNHIARGCTRIKINGELQESQLQTKPDNEDSPHKL